MRSSKIFPYFSEDVWICAVVYLLLDMFQNIISRRPRQKKAGNPSALRWWRHCGLSPWTDSALTRPCAIHVYIYIHIYIYLIYIYIIYIYKCVYIYVCICIYVFLAYVYKYICIYKCTWYNEIEWDISSYMYGSNHIRVVSSLGGP